MQELINRVSLLPMTVTRIIYKNKTIILHASPLTLNMIRFTSAVTTLDLPYKSNICH